MGLPAFDTLKFVEKLEKGGFSKEQAKSMTEAQREVVMEIIDGNLATTTDLVKLKAELKAHIAALDNKIDKVEAGLKADISAVEASLKADISAVDNKIDNLRTEFLGKYTLQSWMISFVLAMCVGILLKLFH